MSTYFKKKRDKNVIRDDVTEETPSISEDKIYDTEIDYENEQYTAQDDKTGKCYYHTELMRLLVYRPNNTQKMNMEEKRNKERA